LVHSQAAKESDLYPEGSVPLNGTDWLVIAAYLLINLMIGVYYRRRSGGNTEEFFVSGRNVSWWLAGTSMVATTFAADTPLVVRY
jgi:Na+/proline symporter